VVDPDRRVRLLLGRCTGHRGDGTAEERFRGRLQAYPADVSRQDEADELTRRAREGRAELRRQRAEVHRRVGETQHAAEEAMRRTADKLPRPEGLRERAAELSESGDRHLRRAEQLSSDGGRPTG
jgi:chromosome segregation ATPase